MREMEKFQEVMMVTLTIDPDVFPDGPEAAYRYLMGKRALGEFARFLRKSGHLISSRFFYCLEFHKNGWPHFHVLIEANYVPHPVLCEAWNHSLPDGRPEADGNRPGLGAVKFSKPKFADFRHAARYATKYLTKYPENGFPEWVLGYRGRIRRFGASQGFWEEESRERNERRERRAFVECQNYFQEIAAGFVDSAEEVTPQPRSVRKGTTVGERLSGCGYGAVILRRRKIPDGSRKSGFRFQYAFYGGAFRSFAECLDEVGGDATATSVIVDALQAKRLCEPEFGSADEFWDERSRVARREVKREGSAQNQ